MLVRTILVAVRTLYKRQEFNFVGPVGDNGLLEDYTAQVRGEPVSCVVVVTRNTAGQTQHIVANYRPRTSLLLLSRLVGEKLADTPFGQALRRQRVLRVKLTAKVRLRKRAETWPPRARGRPPS